MRPHPLPLAVIVCALAPCAGAQAGAFQLRPDLSEGRVLTYALARTVELTQTAPGKEPVKSSAGVDMTVKFTVSRARADGSVEVSAEVQQLTAKTSGAPGEHRFEYPVASDEPVAAPAPEAPGALRPAPGAEPEGHPKKIDADAAFRMFAKSRPRLQVDREGNLVRILGLESFAEVASRADDNPALVMLAPAVFRDMIGPILQPGSPQPVVKEFHPGDGWVDTRKSGLGAIGSVEIKETWTLAEPSDDTVAANARVEVTQLPASVKGAVAPALSISASAGTGSLEWDTAARATVSHLRTLHLETTWTLGDLSVGSTQDSRCEVRLLR